MTVLNFSVVRALIFSVVGISFSFVVSFSRLLAFALRCGVLVYPTVGFGDRVVVVVLSVVVVVRSSFGFVVLGFAGFSVVFDGRRVRFGGTSSSSS